MLSLYKVNNKDTRTTSFWLLKNCTQLFLVGIYLFCSKSAIKTLEIVEISVTAQKVKFSIKDFFTLTEEILNEKLRFLCSVFKGNLKGTRIMSMI